MELLGFSFSEAIDFFKLLLNPESIIRYGGLYLLVGVIFAETGLLAGFFLPGDSLLFLAGMMAESKFLPNSIVTIVVWLCIAAIVGDQFGYVVGKKAGPKIFNKKKSLFFKPEYVTLTKRFFDKHGPKSLVLGRFLPIVRTFAPVLAGVVQMEYWRFVFYNVTGGLLWVFVLTLGGYTIGQMYPTVQHHIEYIVIGFIVVTTIPIVRTIFKERKLAKAQKIMEQEKVSV